MRQRHARAAVRAARRRYIRRRLALFSSHYEGGWQHPKPGVYSKWNGVCSCGLCRAAKFRDGRQATYRRMERLDISAW